MERYRSTLTGETVRVATRKDGRVQYIDENGNRVWLTESEFNAQFKNVVRRPHVNA